jgi:hypothetical protein
MDKAAFSIARQEGVNNLSATTAVLRDLIDAPAGRPIMQQKTKAEWADAVAAVAVIGLCLGFYIFANAVHVPESGNLPVATAGFSGARR